MATVPTLEDFIETCRGEFRFLLDEFGFHEAPGSVPQAQFCVRFTKDDRSLEVRGEGWGTTAACHVFCGDQGPLALIYLVPDAFRPKRSRKRDRMGQLDNIRESARFAREHATDFLGGDLSRFARIWDVHRRQAARLRGHEIKRVLLENEGKRVRITFDDDVVQSVDIAAVDDEGVLHSGPDGVDPGFFWTRFESIRKIERDPMA